MLERTEGRVPEGAGGGWKEERVRPAARPSATASPSDTGPQGLEVRACSCARCNALWSVAVTFRHRLMMTMMMVAMAGPGHPCCPRSHLILSLDSFRHRVDVAAVWDSSLLTQSQLCLLFPGFRCACNLQVASLLLPQGNTNGLPAPFPPPPVALPSLPRLPLVSPTPRAAPLTQPP